MIKISISVNIFAVIVWLCFSELWSSVINSGEHIMLTVEKFHLALKEGWLIKD